MIIRTFAERVNARIEEVNSCVCLGGDSDWEKIPANCRKGRSIGEGLAYFTNRLINATHKNLLAIKLNASFYMPYMEEGLNAMRQIFSHCRINYPGIIRILDGKRADIGNSNKGYVAEALCLGADAVTVNPYFGQEDGLQPFLDEKGLGVIILCRTSNKSAARNQDGRYTPPDVPSPRYTKFRNPFPMPYYQFIANDIAHNWNGNGNCAVVVGATVPEQLAAVREIVGDMIILSPGYGNQGATGKDLAVGYDQNRRGLIVNNSRNLIFAYSNDKFLQRHPEFVGHEERFAEATAVATLEMRDDLNMFRKAA